jgi:tetratricopeptide (TPR) repeat protein
MGWIAAAGLMLAATGIVVADTPKADDALTQANALLAKADFDGAMKVLLAAAKAEPDNQVYREQATLLRQVIRVREALPKLEGTEKWTLNAQALCAYYNDKMIYSEALPLARKLHEQSPTTDTAVVLARIELALDKNDDAAKLLGGLVAEQTTPETRVLLCLALARQKELDAARGALGEFEVPENAGCEMLYDLACAQACLGQKDECLATLTRCFECTPPGRLDCLKCRAQCCGDFASMKESCCFNKAMATESKVADTCSGGTSCGKCPARGGCSGKTTSSCQDKSKDECKDHDQKPKP